MYWCDYQRCWNVTTCSILQYLNVTSDDIATKYRRNVRSPIHFTWTRISFSKDKFTVEFFMLKLKANWLYVQSNRNGLATPSKSESDVAPLVYYIIYCTCYTKPKQKQFCLQHHWQLGSVPILPQFHEVLQQV